MSFGLAKVGLFSGPGVRAAGRVTVVDLGVPRAWVDREVGAGLVEAGDVCAVLPSRSADAHKGHYGHLLVVAGSEGKTGAAALAGRAALRVGTGLVTCAIPASQRALVAGNLPELMTEPLAETAVRTVAGGGATQVLKLADRMAGLALGPGLGLDPETQGVVRELVATVACPLVVDADALTAVATDLGVVRRARGPRILTPHPGEAARLLGCAAAEVQADRIGASRRLAEASGGVVVLKGAGTVVAAPEGSISINPTGNPGMATGGMGDVLTGAVAGLLAQGLAPLWAARAAVYLHGLAGDLAAARHGAAGLLASDVADLLPEAMQQVRSQRP